MACGKCASPKASKTTYTHTLPDGTKKSYSTEVEVKAAVARRGGTYK